MARPRNGPNTPPARSAREPDGPTHAAAFAIDIDPALIEAALDAVERRHAHRADPPADAVAAAAEPAEPSPSVAIATLSLRDLAEVEIGIAVVGDELVVPPELADLLDGLDPERDEHHAASVAADAGPQRGEDEPARPEEGRAAVDPLLLAELEVRGRRLAQVEAEATELRENNAYLHAQIREVRHAASTLASDFDRFRQRARKDREDAERAGEERVLFHLLETADNLDRAFAHAPKENSPVFRGVQMVMDQVRTRLRRLGVERVTATAGSTFNPELHEAMQRVPSTTAPPGSVVEEVIAGYRYRGRLLRPARVTVAMAPAGPPGTEPAPTGPEHPPASSAASPDGATAASPDTSTEGTPAEPTAPPPPETP